MITKIEKYGADWCGPCRVLDKTLEQLADDVIEIVKYDVDEEEELAEKKGIRNIPVLIFYNGDKEVNRTVGALPLGEILKIING